MSNLFDVLCGEGRPDATAKRSLLAVIRGSKLLDEITSEEVEEFRKKRAAEGVAAQPLQHGINLLRSACKLAKRQGYSVPDLNFPNAKIAKHRVRYLSVDEEQQFLRELNPQREARGQRGLAFGKSPIQRLTKLLLN